MTQFLAVLQKLWLTAFVLTQVIGLGVFVSLFPAGGPRFNDNMGNTIGVMVFFIVLYFAGAWWMKWMFTATRRAP